MFLSARPGVTPHNRKVKGALKMCKCALACVLEKQKTKRAHFCQLLKPPVSTDRHFRFLISFFRHLCDIVPLIKIDVQDCVKIQHERNYIRKRETVLVCGVWLFQLVFIPVQVSLRGLSIPPQTSNAALNPSPAPSLIHLHLANNLQHRYSDGKLHIITKIWAQQHKDILFAVVLLLEHHSCKLSLIKADIFSMCSYLLCSTERTLSVHESLCSHWTWKRTKTARETSAKDTLSVFANLNKFQRSPPHVVP